MDYLCNITLKQKDMKAKSLNDIHIQSSLMMKFNREHSGVLSRSYIDMIVQAAHSARLARGLKGRMWNGVYDPYRDEKKTGI